MMQSKFTNFIGQSPLNNWKSDWVKICRVRGAVISDVRLSLIGCQDKQFINADNNCKTG